ncbi:MAG TPA: hypothetical protein VFM73_05860 [Xanthomonadaceae bacterium]|nr:hypothetical protein [Xanthomonadaceae bacterium]
MAGDTTRDGTGRGNRWRLATWGGAAVLLAIPAVAMQFEGSGVHWTMGDFVAMGVLLGIACGAYEIATRMSGHWAYRAGAALAILTCFLTVWVNLAVGMIGDEDNPANLLFGGVILVAMIGAILARFRARGVARAIQVAAVAQGVLAVYALVAGDISAALPIAFFMVPWLLGASLFLVAARDETQP